MFDKFKKALAYRKFLGKTLRRLCISNPTLTPRIFEIYKNPRVMRKLEENFLIGDYLRFYNLLVSYLYDVTYLPTDPVFIGLSMIYEYCKQQDPSGQLFKTLEPQLTKLCLELTAPESTYFCTYLVKCLEVDKTLLNYLNLGFGAEELKAILSNHNFKLSLNPNSTLVWETLLLQGFSNPKLNFGEQIKTIPDYLKEVLYG